MVIANGCDTYAFAYLLGSNIKPEDNMICYFMGDVGNQYYIDIGLNVRGGYKSYTERDKLMTKESDYE